MYVDLTSSCHFNFLLRTLLAVGYLVNYSVGSNYTSCNAIYSLLVFSVLLYSLQQKQANIVISLVVQSRHSTPSIIELPAVC